MPETRIASPGRTSRAPSCEPARHGADARGVDEELVGAAAPDHLGVAGDDGDAGARRRRARRLDDAAQIGERQALLEDEGERQRQRPRAADGEIVDRAVDRQLADVAAGKEDGRHDVGVGGEGEPLAVALDERRVVEPLERRVAERGHDQLLDQLRGEPAARAVAEQDLVAVDERQRTGGKRQQTAASEDIVFSQGDVDLIPQQVQEHGVRLLDAVDRPARHDEAVLAHVGEPPPSRPAKPMVSRPSSRARLSARFTLADAPEVEMPRATSPAAPASSS